MKSKRGINNAITKQRKAFKCTTRRGVHFEDVFARSLKHCKNGKGFKFSNRGGVSDRRPSDFIWCGKAFTSLVEAKQITALDLSFDYWNQFFMNGQFTSLKEFSNISIHHCGFLCINYTNLAPTPKYRFDETYMIDYRFFEMLMDKKIMKSLPLSYIKENEEDFIKRKFIVKLHYVKIPDEKLRIIELNGVLR